MANHELRVTNIHDGDVHCSRCNQTWRPGIDKDPECVPMRADEFLDLGARTFRERNAIYGNNYQREGALLLALFPEGGIPAIKTEADANRLHVLLACVTKLQRYAHNWAQGGHADSARDLMVYAAMLEEFTE